MLRYSFISILFLLSFSTFAQTEIKGRVFYLQTGQPAVSAMLTVHPLGSKSILAYTTTNNEGGFTLKRNSLPDSIIITVASINIEKQQKTVRSDIAFVEFFVKEKLAELKELIVKAPKIRQLGDTLHFSVSSFTDETDRNIGDVLKKLPGIQVLSSGQILYQNKEISKFYIEGLDLLKGKYGMATQNVDASKVATVQILENHQPVKALKGMEIPETAAINLKLKESSVGAFFATAQVGIGLPAFLFSNELVGMRFTRSQQNMFVYKGDNTGRDISRELNSYYYKFRRSSNDFLSLISPLAPSIKEEHYLFNDAHMGAINDLRSIKKDLVLTSNIHFLADKQKSSSFSKRDIFLNHSDTINIIEDMSAHLLKREFESSFTLEGNSPDYFLNNKLSIRSSWNSMQSDILSKDPISQFLKEPTIDIENEFEYIKNKDKQRNKIKSTIGYASQKNSLSVSPLIFSTLKGQEAPIQQDIAFSDFNSDVFYSYYKDLEKLSFGYLTGVSLKHSFMESNLLSGENLVPIIVDSLQNLNKRTETKFSIAPSFTYRPTSDFRVSFHIPLNFLLLKDKDEVRNISYSDNHWLSSPYLSLRYIISARWDVNSNLTYANSIGGINEDYEGYIMTNYRNMNRTSVVKSKNRNTSGYINIHYKNPFTTLFSSLGLSYKSSWKNILYDIQYKDILSSSSARYHPNTSKSFNLRYSMGKSIDAISSELKVHTNYSRNKSLALNQGIISNYSSDRFSISPAITSNIGRFIILKYSASYQHSESQIREMKMTPVNHFTQDISASFIPVKKLSISLSFKQYYNNMIESSARSAWFGNSSLRYKTKKFDCSLDWTNMFNTRQLVSYSYSDISTHYSEYDLRPAEILLKLRFKIL